MLIRPVNACLIEHVGESWERWRGGRPLTRARSSTKLTSNLAALGSCRLPGWNLNDTENRWSDKITDVAQS